MRVLNTHESLGIKSLIDFELSRAYSSPHARLDATRRAAHALRERMWDEPPVLFYRSFDLIRAPYPTYYAFSGVYAQSAFKFPLVHLLNRMFVVQYLDHDRALRTLILSPTDHQANRQTPFFKRLAKGIPQKINHFFAPQYNTVENALAQCGIEPQQVDYISYDHLHTHDIRKWLGSNGEPAYFPNARLLVHHQEWASAMNLLPIQRDWYCPQGIAGIASERILPFEGSLSLGPGLALIHTPGHTEGNHSMAARVPDGIRVSSENGVGVDSYEPINSRINAVRRYAQSTGMEVILNGNTLEGSNDQYISMVLEKTLAGPSENPEYPNCATSSERTPFWAFPGDLPSHLFGEAHFGSVHRTAK